MRLDSWIWNFAGDYPGADQNDARLPVSRVWLKTHEQSVWFSDAQIATYARIYGEQGIDLASWCVPTALADDAALAIRVLRAFKAAGIAEPLLQFDVEVEPGNFWRGTPAQLAGIFQRVKAACPWAHLALCCYQYGAEFGLEDIAPLPEVELLATMDYWTDFKTTPETRLAYSYDKLAGYGKPIQFGLPGNGTPGDMTRALRWLDDRGLFVVPPLIWRRGTTSAATWAAIEAFTPTPPPEPEPSYSDGELLTDLAIVAEGLDNLSARAAVQAVGVRDVAGRVHERSGV